MRGIACSILLAFGWAGSAHAQCSSAEVDQLPGLSARIETWQREHKVSLPRQFSDRLRLDLCVAVKGVVDDHVASREQAEAAAPDAASEYLGAYIIDATLSTPRAILRSRLGVPGLARPTARALALVRFTYVQPLDSLQIGSESLPPRPLILLPPGTKTFVGFSTGKAVCRGTVTVSLGIKANAKC